jgi:hypothetical protein
MEFATFQDILILKFKKIITSYMQGFFLNIYLFIYLKISFYYNFLNK